jgi:hypothetical protein
MPITFTFAYQQVIYSVSLAFYANAAAQAHLATAVKSLRDAEEVQAAACQAGAGAGRCRGGSGAQGRAACKKERAGRDIARTPPKLLL